MQRLQTYIAVLASLLVLTMLLILGSYAVVAEGAKPTIFVVMVPLSCLTLGIAFYLGHLLARPLDELRERIQEWREGNSDLAAPVRKPGFMHFREARLLSDETNALIKLDETQRASLDLLEKRQLDFVGDVAHELRTPLTAIRGDAEVLMDPDLPPELHQKFCENIVRESERLTRLTVDLTTLLKANEDNPEERRQLTDLHEVAEMAVGSLSPILYEHNAQVTITGSAPKVMCDPDRMEEVVSNLIDNANRFIEPGGHIEVGLSEADGFAVLSVSDDGPGFGDIDPRLLFERFYRTDFSRSRNRGGSGLGLAIVKSIVEAHGGSVEAANRKEGGARFTVKMPVAPQENGC